MAASIETAPSFKSVPIDELPRIWDGWGKLVRSGLGISAFGVQIIDFPPDYTTKSHDEAETGQEELYLALRGAGELVIGSGEQRLPLEPGHVARVGPGVERTIATGPGGVRVLCVGGVPGEPYRAPNWTAEPEG